ncbi:hypothetical protein DNTS_009332 [Danionella cerebrum]|uniref:Uncharacterized protein n=1 Tax=Danionella cerebrum TaxID=2873325 RepID=A0A553QCG3_9TELE|nr:hypothetical protein DNTS_009332 [Danionella translucida]
MKGLKKIRNPDRMYRTAVGYTGHVPPKSVSDDTDNNTSCLADDLLNVTDVATDGDEHPEPVKEAMGLEKEDEGQISLGLLLLKRSHCWLSEEKSGFKLHDLEVPSRH